jgi:hypothetical protein
MPMPKRMRVAGPETPLYKNSAEMLRTRLLTIEWRINWHRWTVEMESEFHRFSQDVARYAHKQLRTVSWQDETMLQLLSTIKLPKKRPETGLRPSLVKRFALKLAEDRNLDRCFRITLR